MSQDVEARTSADGTFALKGVAPGAVQIQVKKDGYAGAVAPELELRPGEQRDGLVLALLIGGRIEGEIVAQDAAQRAGQQLQLGPSRDARAAGWSGMWQTATSDGAGRFVFDHVMPGTYNVQRLGMGVGSSVEVAVVDGETVRVVLGRPAEGAIRVFGTVTRGGSGVTGATVMAFRQGEPCSARTDATGGYELFVDGPGQYWFSVSEDKEGASGTSRQQEIAAGAEQRVDFNLSSGRIRGRVLAPDGAALPGAYVWASGQDGHGQTMSGPDGAFEIEGLPGGTLHLQAQADAFSEVPRYAPATREVELAEGATLDGVELRLAEAGVIEGSVVTAAGQPLAGASILVSNVFVQQDWATDGAGRFRIGGLAGPCTIWARKGPLVSETRTVDVRAKDTVQVNLTADSGTLVQVLVENPEAWFPATLTDARGVAHSWADPRDPELRALGGEKPKGAQRIGPLPPGEYTLAVGERKGGRSVTQSVTLKGEPFREIEVKLE